MSIRTKHFVWDKATSLPEKIGAMTITREARVCMLRFARWGIVRTSPYAISIERNGKTERISLSGPRTGLQQIARWMWLYLFLMVVFASFLTRR